MKIEQKISQKIEFANCELTVVDGRLVLIEYDKEGNPMDEYDLINELENQDGFLDEVGFKVTIVRSMNK